MEINQKDPNIPREFYNRTFSEFIVDAFSLFKNTFIKLFPLYLVISIVFLVISSFVTVELSAMSMQASDALTNYMNNLGTDYENITDEELNQLMSLMMQAFPLLLLDIIVLLMFSILPEFIAYGLVGSFLYKTYLKQNAEFGEEVSKSLKIEVFLIPGLLSIIIPLGLLLLLIPGLLMYIYWIFAPPMHSIEAERNLGGIKASYRYSRNNFWKIFGSWLVYVFVSTIISLIYTTILDFVVPTDAYNAALNPATRNYLVIILYQLLFGLFNIIMAPLLPCLLTTTLVFCKIQAVRRYGPSQYYGTPSYPAEQYPTTIPEIPEVKQTEIKSGEPLYCPYCGFTMDKSMNYRFCPSCGGKIPKG